MKNYLFAALFLGSFFAFITSQSESFNFIDSQGRCWRCTAGSCSACPAAIIPQPRPQPILNFPQEWDRTCPRPTTQNCTDFPTGRFPAEDINWFWDCSVNNGRVPIQCECDKGFHVPSQQCVYAEEMLTIGCTNFANTTLIPCNTTETTTTVSTTTVSSTSLNPCVCIPFWPCRCNPCWHMPCHNCGGCGMMMG